MNLISKLGMVMVMFAMYGCANTSIKMVDDQTFVSTNDPNIQIEVASDYVLKKDDRRNYTFEFLNQEEGRYVMIQYWQRPMNTRKIGGFYDPSKWIFYNLPDCEDIDTGDIMLSDQRWYFRDYVHHESSSSCSLVRDMGHFARNYSVLKVLYLQKLPPYKCHAWSNLNRLSADQQEKLNRFLNTHQEDIKMSVYEPAAN